MATYDQATKDFMGKLADGEPEPEGSPAVTALRMVRRTLRSGSSPEKALVRTVTKLVADEVFDKTAGLKPLQVYQLLNEHYGREWWEWEPETIWRTLQEDHQVGASEDLRNLIGALQVTARTNFPFEMWHIFENVGNAFNLNGVDFSTMQPMELTEIARAIKILRIIRPKTSFEEEILGYIAAAGKSAGMVFLPNALFGGSQTYLDEMNNDLELKDKVMKLYHEEKPGTTEAEKIQLGRLAEIKAYAEDI